MTNDVKQGAIDRIEKVFTTYTGTGCSADPAVMLTEILVDLRHWADKERLDWGKIEARVIAAWLIEREDEKTPRLKLV